MTRASTLFTSGAVLACAVADIFTLSLGDIGQYSTSLATAPTLTGSRVLFTDPASSNGGVDVVLSEELRAKVQKAVDSDCNTINAQCVESVRTLLINPRTELESRSLVAFAAGAIALISLAIPWWGKQNQGVPVALHMPSAQLGSAASAANAATVAAVTGSGVPFVTITSTPTTTSTPGPEMPTETILTSAQDGHAVGDLGIFLSEDLAQRLSEMIARSQQCPASDGRPKAKTAKMKALSLDDATNTIGEIICAARSLVINAASGGPFAELAAIHGKQPAWSSPGMMQAMQEVADFAVAQAGFLRLNGQDATTLAFVSFYVAYMVIKNKAPLGRVNWIPGTEFKGTVTESPIHSTITTGPTMAITTSTASSSSMFECSASCTMVGAIRNCNTWCATPTDDSFTMPTPYAVKTVAIEPWVVPVQVPIQVPIGICPPAPGNATDFPVDLFEPVYSKFCEEAEKSSETTIWTVNSKGEKAEAKPRLRRLAMSLRRFVLRDGSADDNKYNDYRFQLIRFVRSGGKQTCATKCARAFRQLSHQDNCRRGDDKKMMADTGVLDAGCAEYIFSIETPKPPEVKAEIKCGQSDTRFTAPKYDSGADGAIGVETAIKRWCTDNDHLYLNHNPDGDQKYARWPITQLKVPNRSSFWTRAKLNNQQENGVIIKDQCISAYTDGLKQCDQGSDRTHGFSAVVGTTAYTLEVSGFTQDGNPPWNEKSMFPPVEYHGGPECSAASSAPGYKPVFPDDLEKAMSWFCVNGAPLKDFGRYWQGCEQYPPKGQPRFYNSERYMLVLGMGAQKMTKTGAGCM
ncbi:hypothetical protein BDU57DRAFT_537190 [Ampelomyces quisqualis]|uniref:Uncharacterized protein n=1 Tax=Ampelomyces quisqualis TaxID=50730 RepID=A0A6A5QQ88_AMPQU|nr:hypothetical protein BDU57DRAFT_537190 [Ampelomyces quisqualis]